MEYELKVLEHTVTVGLNPLKLKPENLNDEFLSEILLLAENEAEKIRNQFTAMVCGELQESQLAFYYQTHQCKLVQLADIIFNYLQPGGPESFYLITKEVSILNYYKRISRILEELLNIIEKDFPRYFDHDIKVPDTKILLMAPEIKLNLKLIQKELRKLDVDDKLIEITCFPLENYLLPGTVHSYRELAYLQEFNRELISFTKRKDKTNANEELCQLLLQLKFNSIVFFSYYTLQLQEKSNTCNTLPDLIEYHSLKLKINNQLPVKAGMIYKPALPPIREQVGFWICDELSYLEQQVRLLNLFPVQIIEEVAKEMKIHTSLSVPQLAMLVKIVEESKLITNKNASDLRRMVSRNFRTDWQETISEESLRNKSYNFERSTVNKVKDKIFDMLDLVNKYKV